jgi:hypothetical protein
MAWLPVGWIVSSATNDTSLDAADARPQAAADAQIAALIAELDNNRYVVREQATQKLLVAGASALDPLLAAANGGRPEPADRAVWVLRKLGNSQDRQLALAALDRLIQLKGRPAVVQEATRARSRFYELECQEALAKLGGKLAILDRMTLEYGAIQLVHIVLDKDWHGTPHDLECLADLDQHRFFRIEGAAVGNAEIKPFESMDHIVQLQIWRTRVTPEAVDAFKQQQPKTNVHVKNQALLGIGGGNHKGGVMVQRVEDGTAASAAEIAENDVITHLNGKQVKDFDRLTAEIAQHKPGEQIEVTILRGSEKLTKRVTLGEWPPGIE